MDPNNGVIRYANENLPGYTGMDVKGYFEAQFQRPAAVLNDVCAAALGEGTRGAACLLYTSTRKVRGRVERHPHFVYYTEDIAP